MKISSKTILLSSALINSLFIISCGTTNNTKAITEIKETAPTVEKKLESPYQIYSEKVNKLVLTASGPKETVKNNAFNTAFTVNVKDLNGNPVENLDLAMVYPAEKKDGQIVFETINVKTTSDGSYSFESPIPTSSYDSEISFYPAGDLTDEKIAALAKEKSVNLPYKVQTNLKSAGGVIAVVDFNQNGKALTSNPVSSSKMLMSLMKLGFTRIGNIDLTSAVIAENEEKIYKGAKDMVGNASKYIIFGTIKVTSIENTETGVTCTLNAKIKCMDLLTKEITFVKEEKVAVTEKSEWAALESARKTMSENLSIAIKYGI